MALNDHQSTVDRKTRAPEDIVTPADRDAAIQAAVLRYSQDRPLRRVVDVTVLADENEIALPPTWASGESVLLSVEAPTGEAPPSLLDVAAYAIVARPNGDALLISDTFSAATQCRLTFTGPHVVSAATDTVPARDREALGYWAAAILCDQVAAHHAENREPTIQADRVDYTSPAKEWGRRAEACRRLYFQLMGIDTGPGGASAMPPKPAGAVVNLDVPESRLRERLAGRRWR